MRSGAVRMRPGAGGALLTIEVAVVLGVTLDIDAPDAGLTRVPREPLHAIRRAIDREALSR
jgi:hypothetical protein